MAHEIGIATNYRDLLDKLRVFLTSNNWTEKLWESSPTRKQLVVMGHGLDGESEVFCGIDAYEDAAQGWHWWDIQGLSGFAPGQVFSSQPGVINDYPAGMPLWQYAIPYWFSCNDRRFIVVAKVGTNFEAAYAGLMLPYTTPGQWPYPMFIGGSMTNTPSRLRSRVDEGHRVFFKTNTSAAAQTAARIWSPGGWEPVTTALKAYPYCVKSFELLGSTEDGQYPLIPVQYLKPLESESERASFGQLDGVYYISGYLNAAENILEIDGKRYLVIQNVFRTTLIEHAAILLDD